MFKTILVPTDGSPSSAKAIAAAVALASLRHSQIVALTVVDLASAAPLAVAGGGYTPSRRADEESARLGAAQQRIDQVTDAAQAAGLSTRALVAISPRPHEEIVKTAAAQHCDLIVMAAHRRKGLKHRILGSETEQVLRHTDIPVLVVRP